MVCVAQTEGKSAVVVLRRLKRKRAMKQICRAPGIATNGRIKLRIATNGAPGLTTRSNVRYERNKAPAPPPAAPAAASSMGSQKLVQMKAMKLPSMSPQIISK